MKIEVTFRKSTNQRFDKKGAESRRRPTPFAGDWPRQPTAAGRLPDQRLTTVCRPTLCVVKETPPPPIHTLPDTTRPTITYAHTQKTAIIETALVIKKPTTLPSSPNSPPKKRTRHNSTPEPTREPSDLLIFYDAVSKLFPLHKKYDLQEVSDLLKNFKAVAVKAQRLPRPDEPLNVYLPAFFMYHREKEN